MAEVFGLIASGVSIGALAGQIASSVVKLKSYLDQIRDVPEDISILINEIEDLHFLLSDIEDDQQRNPYSAMLVDNKSATRCLDRCKRGVERLQLVVDEIALEFERFKPMKRRWKATKIILKWDRVEKYKAELASAVRLLTLSHQIYTRSLMQLQPDIITSRIAQLLRTESARRESMNLSDSSIAQVQGFSSSIRRCRTVEPSRLKRIQSSWLRWKSYSLLLGRAWDIEMHRSQQGWNFSISIYSCVSYDSLVAKYIRDGNVEGLQRLFSQGEASPFTICLRTLSNGNVWRRSLLEIGANYGNFKICEFLINEGADPEFFADHERSSAPIGCFIINGVWECFFNSDSCRLARLLGARSEITLSMLARYRGPDSIFSILLKYMDAPIGEFPIEDRCDTAILLARSADCNSPDLFLMALGCNPIPCTAITYHAYGGAGETLLHAAAGALGQLAASCGEEFDQRCILGWRSIIQELLAAGADLYATCSRHYTGFRQVNFQLTPLMWMFACCVWVWTRSYISRQDLGKAMSAWISTLHDCGVDLKEYGLRESLTWVVLETLINTKTDYNTGVTRKYDSNYYFGRKRLLGFSYGLFPEDWRIWENEPTDEFAGEFWLMLDRREEVMPGAWIE